MTSSTKRTMVFEKVDVAYINAIRRTILSEIENVAVCTNNMKFHVNTTSLHNEFMQHRLSLIPLHLTAEQIENFNPGTYKFVIDAKNEGDIIKNITTNDITIYNNEGVKVDKKTHKQIFPPYKHSDGSEHYILITKMKKGEELHVEFRAAKGIAKDNAKWSPVSTASYTYEVDTEEYKKQLQAKKSANASKDELNFFKTIEKQRIYKKDKHGRPNAFRFVIETECRMEPIYILNQAVKKVIENLRKFSAKLKKVVVENGVHILEFEDEGYTISNIIHTTMINNYVDKQKRITYAGYIKPHALEDIIVFKIKFINEDDNVEGFIASCVKDTINKMNEFLD